MCDDTKNQGHDSNCCRFSQLARDVAVSRSAIGLLQNLLVHSQLEQLDAESISGLALLLESPHQRLGLAIDSLDEMHPAHSTGAAPPLTEPPTDPPA